MIADPFDVRMSLSNWSDHYGVDSRLARARAWQESGFNNSLVSSAGVMGVMQLLPQTWDYVETILVGAQIPHTVDGNVHAGGSPTSIDFLAEFNGDERLCARSVVRGCGAQCASTGCMPRRRRSSRTSSALKQRM